LPPESFAAVGRFIAFADWHSGHKKSAPQGAFYARQILQIFQSADGFLQNFLRIARYHQAVVADEQFVRDTGEAG